MPLPILKWTVAVYLAVVTASLPAAGQAAGDNQTTLHAEAVLKPIEIKAAAEKGREFEPTRPSIRLKDNALRERIGNTLGETLGDEAGVSNSTFGPGVGLPVVRGMSGPRVRLLSNGLATHDATTFSPDHAASIESILADEVQVMRGPATIRYGGNAIGGAVNVIDNRIPGRVPRQPVSGMVQSRYNFNGNENINAFKIDAGTGRFAMHVDGFMRHRNNISINGCAVDDNAVQQQFGLINTRNTCGFVANTGAASQGGSLGGSLFADVGMVGASATMLDNKYGIPPSASSHSHAGGSSDASIDLLNRRYDGRMEFWGSGKWVDLVRLSVSRVHYRHHEKAGNTIATTFRNDALDGRLEVEHRLGPRITGVVGGQMMNRDFSALGAEAFIPQTNTFTTAAYIHERLDITDTLRLEGGWRHDQSKVISGPQPTVDGRVLNFPARSFSLQNRSIGLTWQYAEKSTFGVIFSESKRAPEVHELYSFGPHLATHTFDTGNSNLKVESMKSLDLTWDADTGWVRVNGALFLNDAENFIFQRNVPSIFFDADEGRFRTRCVSLDQCLSVARYEQSSARFMGYEAEATFRILSAVTPPVEVTLFSDYVHSRLDQIREDVPRQPPLRYGMQLVTVTGPWSARLRYTHAHAQDRPGTNETKTNGYNLLNLHASYQRKVMGRTGSVFLRARNLLNEEIRSSTSFLRNFSPEPGRSVELGVELLL
ncbi:MAG: TonB-dependent receptor [Nitrosospira sp.]|nr:TonB-dependent receptor [Nitrosospira sp.]